MVGIGATPRLTTGSCVGKVKLKAIKVGIGAVETVVAILVGVGAMETVVVIMVGIGAIETVVVIRTSTGRVVILVCLLGLALLDLPAANA